MPLPINLPVIQRRVLDHSILSEMGRCPRKALYKYVYNRRANDEDTESSDFGTAGHTFCEMLDVALAKNPTIEPEVVKQVAFNLATKNFKDPDINGKKSYLDKSRLALTANALFDKWVRESSYVKVLHTETSFELPLPSGRLYGGRFDRIIEWNAQLWVKDFKFTSWLQSNLGDKYAIDHQMSGYVWAAQKLTNRRIAGVLVEVIHNTQKDKAKIHPVMTTRTPQDINSFIEWAEDGWDEWERRNASGVWSMRTTSCFDFNKKCAFHDACSKGDYQSIETWLEENSEESVWDHANPRD